MAKSDIEKKLNSLENRIVKLEKIVLNQKVRSSPTQKYKGLVGGISFLIDNGFFNKLVSVDQIHDELKKEGYPYPYNSVDKILRVDFVNKKKKLIRDKENGIWKYALRK